MTIAVLAATSAPAAPPHTKLSAFDRLAVTINSPRKVFSVVRTDTPVTPATLNEVREITPPRDASDAFDPIPGSVAWAPGAGSYAITEIGFTGLSQPRARLRIVEHPGGAVRNLGPGIQALNSAATISAGLGVPRFSNLQGLAGPRAMLTVPQIGVVSLRLDGSDARIHDDSAFGTTDHALFNTGLRAVATASTHITPDNRAFEDLVVLDLQSGTRIRQLTDTPFVSESSPVLSPDETKIAYIQPAFQNAAGQSRLFVINADGTGNTAISPDTTLMYSQPAWRPDGQRIAFIGHNKPGANGIVGAPIVYSIKPDGTDLQRHTVSGALPAGTNINGLFPRDLAWGRTCSTVLSCNMSLTLVDPAPSGLEVQLQPQLSAAASIGILVERYAGRRLVRVGRVPFGSRSKGRPRVRWNGRVAGRRLAPGRYRITLRRLVDGVALEVSQPVDLVVPRRGAARVVRARRL